MGGELTFSCGTSETKTTKAIMAPTMMTRLAMLRGRLVFEGGPDPSKCVRKHSLLVAHHLRPSRCLGKPSGLLGNCSSFGHSVRYEVD